MFKIDFALVKVIYLLSICFTRREGFAKAHELFLSGRNYAWLRGSAGRVPA